MSMVFDKDGYNEDSPALAPQTSAPAKTTGRNIYDFVQCTPWRRDGESRALRGVIAPVMYEITGSDASRDKPFIAEATGTGPGLKDHLGHLEAVCVKPGDVFICNLHNISYRVTEGGQKTYMVRSGVIYATISVQPAVESDDAAIDDILGGNAEGPKEFKVNPVQDLILVRKNEERALLHMRGRANLPNGELWLPTEAMATDDVRSPAIVAEYGEVVSVGPGRYRDGRWSEPPCKAGDLIIYDGSYSTLPIRIRGESFTLVPAPQLVKIADEG